MGVGSRGIESNLANLTQSGSFFPFLLPLFHNTTNRHLYIITANYKK
jgi:hypothetical protein